MTSRQPRPRLPAQAKLVWLGRGGSFWHSPSQRCLGLKLLSLPPSPLPAFFPSWPPERDEGEKLGAQNPATRGPDEFHSNRSIGAGRSLVPGPRNLLASAWTPGSDPSAGARPGGFRAVPSGFPNKRFVSPRWRNFSPKRASGAHIFCRGLAGGRRQWAATDGVGWVTLTFLLLGSPHTLQAPLQRKAFLWYLAKSCGGKRRAAAGSSLWEAQREPWCSQTLLWSFPRIANYWGKTDLGLRVGGGKELMKSMASFERPGALGFG